MSFQFQASPDKEVPGGPFKPPVQDTPPSPAKVAKTVQTAEPKRQVSPEQPDDPKPASNE